jgi:hypothetical protein
MPCLQHGSGLSRLVSSYNCHVFSFWYAYRCEDPARVVSATRASSRLNGIPAVVSTLTSLSDTGANS